MPGHGYGAIASLLLVEHHLDLVRSTVRSNRQR